MAFKDLREFLTVLEEMGELRRIEEEVDWRYEVAAWGRRSYDMKPPGPALLFEKIKGYGPEHRILTNGISSYRRVALALGLPADTPIGEIIQVCKQRLANPIAPRIGDEGPVQENILRGDEIDLFKFPVPWWTPRDAGRYIATWNASISKNAKTGVTNLGVYRMQVFDKNHAGIGFGPRTHMNLHYVQQQLKDEPLEIAVAIGVEEAIVMAAIAGMPESVDEYAVAGGLRGEPIELVKCQTVDLCVPATAEIVLEGKILPHIRKPEGPFGEHPGYHGGGVRMRPVCEITCISHRDNPIFRGQLHGKPITESHIVSSLLTSAAGLAHFQRSGPPGVKAIHCPPEADPVLNAVIQMKPYYVGHSRDVGRFWHSTVGGRKYLIVVDEDIDPFDLSQVWWAVVTRTRASRDFEVLPFGRVSRSDPSAPREGEYTDHLTIDATKKLDYPYVKAYGGHWPPVCVPPKEVMELAELKWRKCLDDEAIPDKKIEALSRELDRMEKEWSKFRQEAYTLDKEEQEREIPKSYPIISKEG